MNTAQDWAALIIFFLIAGAFLVAALFKAGSMVGQAVREPGLLVVIPVATVVVGLVGTAISGALMTSILVGLAVGVGFYLLMLFMA